MRRIKYSFVILAALLLLGCGLTEEQLIDVKIAAERQARGELLLDVREADDYKEFHAPNASNIPMGRLALRLAELEQYKSKTIMVIDHAMQRAPRALEILQKAGFAQVVVVKGGMAEWKSAGLPIEKLDMQAQQPQVTQESPEPQQAQQPLQAQSAPEPQSPQVPQQAPQPQQP